MLLLSDEELAQHLQKIGHPLPVSVSTLQKDRSEKKTGKRIGIPYRKTGRRCKYNPEEIIKFFEDLPNHRLPSLPQPQPIRRKQGRPTKIEEIQARERGITVSQLRAMGV